MRGRKTKIAGIVFGCGLLAATSGCSFHRTGHGFVVGSQWSLEYNRTPWLTFRSADGVDPGDDPSDLKLADDDSVAKRPELLPWRSRLKGYRFGARIFRGRSSMPDQHDPQRSTPLLARLLPTKPPPAPTATPSDNSEEDDSRPLASEADEIQLPTHFDPLPEPSRPDLVVN